MGPVAARVARRTVLFDNLLVQTTLTRSARRRRLAKSGGADAPAGHPPRLANPCASVPIRGWSSSLAGDYSRGEDGASSGTLWNVEFNQSQTTSISQNDTGTTSSSESGISVTGDKSGNSYYTSTSTMYPAETNMGDMVGPPALSVTATETDQSTDSTTFSGNDITGYNSTSSHDTDTLTRPESISNATSDTTGSKYSLTTVDTSETANSISGGYSLTEITNASFSNHETDANTGLSTTNTETGQSTGTTHRSGNEILGNYSLSETSDSSTTVVENDTVGAIATSATTYASDYSSTSATGNDVTGSATTSETTNSSATHYQTDNYGGGDSDAQTVTTIASSSNSGSDNSITGSFTLSESSGTTTSTHGSGSRSGNSYSDSQTDVSTVVNSYQMGNEVIGYGSSSETDTDSSTLTNIGTSTSGGYTIVQTDNSTATVYSTDNSIIGNSTTTTYDSDTNAVNQVGNALSGVPPTVTASSSLFSTDTTSSTAVETGNTITGAYSSTTTETESTSLSQTGTDSTGGYTVTSSSSQSPTIYESGNNLSGDYTFSESPTEGYSFNETVTSGSATYTMAETGSNAYSLTQSGNHVTGQYTLSNTGTDGYTITENGTDASGEFGQSLTGSDSYSTNEGGNELSGQFGRTITGGGSDNLVDTGYLASSPYNSTPATNYTVAETGNYLSGAINLTETGLDRNGVLAYFSDSSNADAANGPGDLDYSPVGPAVHIGFSPVAGIGPSGVLDMAAVDANFHELGLDLLHEYCFAAGTLVAMVETGVGNVTPPQARSSSFGVPDPAVGLARRASQLAPSVAVERQGLSYKRIEDVEPGEEVWASPDGDPTVEPAPCVVEDVYHNEPARLLAIHAGALVLRVTFNHEFYLLVRGWTAAEDLAVGDQLLTRDGKRLPVTAIVNTGEIEPVFNLRVRGRHTYFVAGQYGGPAVLVHNESVSVRDGKVYWTVQKDGWLWNSDVATYEIGTVDNGQVQINEQFGGGQASLQDVKGQADNYWNSWADISGQSGDTQQRMIGNALGNLVTRGKVLEGDKVSYVGAAAEGLKTGGKAVLNSAVKTVVSTATLGQVEAGDAITVTEQDRQNGYDTSAAFARGGTEILVGVATGGAVSALSKGGKVAKGVSYGLRTLDAAQNAVDIAGGANDIRKNGVTLENGMRVAGGLLGTAGDVADLRKATKGTNAAVDATTNTAHMVPLTVLQDTCFAAHTPVLTPDGSKMIESLRVGDPILSRPDGPPTGPVRISAVEAVFELSAQIVEVHVGGKRRV